MLRMIDYLKEEGIVSEEEMPIVLYGMKIVLITVVEFISILLLAIWRENILEGLWFLLGFCPLRLYVGGYHSKTPIQCYFMTIAVYMVFSLLLAVIPVEMYRTIELITGVLTFCMVHHFAPIVHENRKINFFEVKRYRCISMKIILIDLLLIVISEAIAPRKIYIFSFSLGLAIVCFFMIVVLVKGLNLKRRKR